MSDSSGSGCVRNSMFFRRHHLLCRCDINSRVALHIHKIISFVVIVFSVAVISIVESLFVFLKSFVVFVAVGYACAVGDAFVSVVFNCC